MEQSWWSLLLGRGHTQVISIIYIVSFFAIFSGKILGVVDIVT